MQVERNRKRTIVIKVLLSVAMMMLAGQDLIAQPLVVIGTVRTGETLSLPFASVQLLLARDSTVIASGETNINGAFALRDSARSDAYILKASFVGYQSTYHHIVAPFQKDTLAFGTIMMQETAIRLEEVTIAENRDPIVIKNDTVEYRMEAFPTLHHANVESLLRKIPGLDVDEFGNVNANGEPVTRIYINGKEMFGDNLLMITKKLPADFVAEVQIFDNKSDAERFSSSVSASGARAINIQLKDNNTEMLFGSASGGIAGDKRYTGESNFNYFDERSQAMALLKSNNINNIDFDNPRQMTGLKPIEGLLTTHTGAVSGFRNLTDKLSINGSYHVNLSDSKFDTHVVRQNFLPEGIGTSSQRSNQRAEVSGQQAVAGMQYKDSTNTLRLTGSGNISEIRTRSTSTRDSKSPEGNSGYSGQQSVLANNANVNGNALIFYGHRFRRKGRTFTVDAQLTSHINDVKNENSNTTIFFDSTYQDANTISHQDKTNERYLATVTYTEPLGKLQQISASYSISNQASESRIDVSETTERADVMYGREISTISTRYQYQQVGLVYQVIGKRLTFFAGAELQEANLSRENMLNNEAMGTSFQNVLPHATLNVRLSEYMRLGVQYDASVREPSIDELQPLQSFIDPLDVYLPNLDLRPEYSHGLRLNFSTTDKKRKPFFLSGSVKADYTTNPIIRSIIIDEDMRRTSQYTNSDNSKSVAANFSISIPMTQLNSTVKVISSGNYRDQMNIINHLESPQTESHIHFNMEYSYSYKAAFSFDVAGYYGITSSYNPILWSEARDFVEMGFLGEMHLFIIPRLELSGTFHYKRLENTVVDFDANLPMLHVSLKMFLLKNNNFVLRISGNNLLEQKSVASQLASSSYIEQRTHEAVLGRFILIGVTWNLK